MTPEEMQQSIELLWQDVERLTTRFRQIIAQQTASVNQRLELAQRVERLADSIEKLSDHFYRLLQQHDEINADADERERGWIHEHKTTLEGITKALSDLRVEIATSKTESQITDQAAAATAKVVDVASTEIKKLRDEVTNSHKLVAREELEEEEEIRYPWYGRIAIGYLRSPPRVQILSIVFVLVLIFGGWVAAVLYDRLGHRNEERRPEHWERSRREPAPPPASP